MTDIRECILAAVQDGHLSKDAGDEYIQRLNELQGQGPDFHTSKVESAVRAEAELRRKIDRKKRMKIKQAQRQAVLTERINAAPSGKRNKAALSVLDFDPALEFVGENTSVRHLTTRSAAFGLVADFIDKHRSRVAGLKRGDKASLREVVRGLFGEDVSNEARLFADGIATARKYLVGRFNAAGGDIQRRKDWGWTQRHDRIAISAVSKDEWAEFVLTRLDAGRMYGPDGFPLTAEEVVKAVDASYHRIVTGGLEEIAGSFDHAYTSPVNSRVAHRELVFKDADAWIEYQERFGSGDIFSAIIGDLDRLSRDVAIIETLGPYPKATLKHMKDLIDADRGAAALEGEGRTAAKISENVGQHGFLDALYDRVTGVADIPASSGFARVSQTNRNLITSARLGSALFVSLGDLGTNTLTAKMNGMPIRGLFGELFGQLNPLDGAHRRMAARAGFVAETWIGDLVAANRLMGEVTGPAWSSRVADTVLRLSGLSAWTDGGRNAFMLELIGHMTDNAGKAFKDMEPTLLASMKRHGITADDWDLFRSTALWKDPETGAEIIRPEDVWLQVKDMTVVSPAEKNARFLASQKIAGMIQTEGHYAVVKPTARSRTIITGGSVGKPGTFWGEAIRNVTLFKSFMVSHTYLHMSRMMTQRGLAGKAQYAAWLAASMTAAGAIAEQASAVFRGKDPRDMDDPRFWASAAVRGGGFGPVGDFLYASTGRHGQTLGEALLGPVLGGQLKQGARLTIDNVRELIETGEARNAGYEAVQFAKGMIPGNSLWYMRAAFDRLIADEFVAWADPNAAERFARIERQARKEYDQGFWWRPGHATPDRAPKF